MIILWASPPLASSLLRYATKPTPRPATQAANTIAPSIRSGSALSNFQHPSAPLEPGLLPPVHLLLIPRGVLPQLALPQLALPQLALPQLEPLQVAPLQLVPLPLPQLILAVVVSHPWPQAPTQPRPAEVQEEVQKVQAGREVQAVQELREVQELQAVQEVPEVLVVVVAAEVQEAAETLPPLQGLPLLRARLRSAQQAC